MNSLYFYVGIIGFAGGIAITSILTIPFVYVVLMVLLAASIWVIARRGNSVSPSGNLYLVSVMLVVIALGVIRFELATLGEVHPLYEAQIGSEVSLEGVVVREPDVRENVTHLYVSVDGEILLVKTHRYTSVQYGDLLLIKGALEKPESFETDLGRTFNYPRYLNARGVSYAVSFADVEIQKTGQGNWFIGNLLSGKQIFMNSIEQVLPEPEVGLAEGLLLGVKQALGDEIETIFRRTGIIHIVVLSGYNVMLVVIFMTYILSFMVPYSFRFPFGVIAIICFAILVGLSATVVRASIMASLILLARATSNTYMVMRALLLAGLIMIILNPYLLVFDVGFQLSFVATLGLIFLAPFVERKVRFMPTTFGLREFLTATIATQIFVTPILLYNIGELSIVSIVVNVLVLPMVPVAMLLTFVTGIVGLFSSTLASMIGFFTYLSLAYILEVATFFAQVPFAAFSVPAFPFWVVSVSYALFGFALYKLYFHTQTKTESLSSAWVIEEEDELIKRITASQSDAVIATSVRHS